MRIRHGAVMAVLVTVAALSACDNIDTPLEPRPQYDMGDYCNLSPEDCEKLYGWIGELQRYRNSSDPNANARCQQAGYDAEWLFWDLESGYEYNTYGDEMTTTRTETSPGVYFYGPVKISEYYLNVGWVDAWNALSHEMFHMNGWGWDSKYPTPGTEHGMVNDWGNQCGLPPV